MTTWCSAATRANSYRDFDLQVVTGAARHLAPGAAVTIFGAIAALVTKIDERVEAGLGHQINTAAASAITAIGAAPVTTWRSKSRSAPWCMTTTPMNCSVTCDSKANGCWSPGAAGGGHGNLSYKSSTNRAPRQFEKGGAGEERDLRLELRLLADVGLLGLPNAGKSTLIRAVSAARPKVADYPFTTLYPNLGVVRVAAHESFVLADIPGLIPGASEGAGLGTRFLKHLSRTRLLLHLVDMAPVDGSDPAMNIRALEMELAAYSPTLAARPRWLVVNKSDLLPGEEAEARFQQICTALQWESPAFLISAASGAGCEALVYAIWQALPDLPPAADPTQTEDWGDESDAGERLENWEGDDLDADWEEEQV